MPKNIKQHILTQIELGKQTFPSYQQQEKVHIHAH